MSRHNVNLAEQACAPPRHHPDQAGLSYSDLLRQAGF